MRTHLLLTTAGAAVAALGLLASGCGGGSSSSPGVARLGTNASATGTSTTPTNTQPNRQDFQAAVLAFARCMRANGVNMPDPTFGGAGGGGGGLFRQRLPNQNNPKTRKAMDKCRSKLDAVRPTFTPAQQKEMQARALKFAQCMRKNGVNMPDPDFSQGGGRGIFGGRGINPDDPKVREAFEKCQPEAFGANGRRGGPGGGFFIAPPPGGGNG